MDLAKKLASQSAVIFAVRLFGAGLVFLVQAAIARFWGGEKLGQYLLTMAAINLIAVVLPLGFQTIGTYFAAEYRARDEGKLLRRFVRRSYLQLFIAAGLVFGLGWMALGPLGEPGRLLAQFWWPAAVLATAMAVVFLNGAILVGLKRPFAGFFADALFRPLLLISAFAVALALGEPESGIGMLLVLLAVSYAGIALIHFLFVVRSVARVPREDDPRARQPARWWRFAAPWVLIALASDFFFDIDLILLSALLPHDELAIFGVCTRVFALVSFGIAAIYAVTLPDMFEAEANSDRATFDRKIGDANLVAAMLSVLLFAAMALGGPLVLMLFGPAFLAGSGPLAVLSLALVVRSVFGPASLVLSIHDRPYASLPAIGCGLAALFAGNLVLVPPMGLMGAALSAVLAITVWSVLLWMTARRLAGIDVSIFPRLAALRGARASGWTAAGS